MTPGVHSYNLARISPVGERTNLGSRVGIGEIWPVDTPVKNLPVLLLRRPVTSLWSALSS